MLRAVMDLENLGYENKGTCAPTILYVYPSLIKRDIDINTLNKWSPLKIYRVQFKYLCLYLF